MNENDKSAQQHRGVPVVRSTAPAGTPHVLTDGGAAPGGPLATPLHVPRLAPTALENVPRTVGGHTARLAVPEEEPLSLAPLESHSPAGAVSVPVDVVLESKPGPLPGSTVRLVPVAGAEGAPKPASPAAGADRSHDAPAAEPPAADASKRAAELRELFAMLFAPVSVAVGLVFFAMGSMLTLVVDGRVIRLSVASAHDPRGVVSSAPPVPPSVAPSATSAGPTHEAATPVSLGGTPNPPVTSGTTAPPSVTEAAQATSAPSVPSSAPGASSSAAPPGSAKPHGGSKRPPIIF